ncbi:hypothetical protein BH24ACI2_BH24ACI2_04580 [soil metagenome]
METYFIVTTRCLALRKFAIRRNTDWRAIHERLCNTVMMWQAIFPIIVS